MGLTDIYISQEVLEGIRDASSNSQHESATKKDGLPRGQVVQHQVDAKGRTVEKPSLQNKFYPGKVVDQPRKEYRESHTGSPHHYVVQEGPYKADPGFKMDGIGHGHQDVTGKPKGEAKFSEDDKNTARGGPKVDGVPVGRIDESDQSKLHVLVPQVECTEPKERIFDAKTLEPIKADDRNTMPRLDLLDKSSQTQKR